MSRRPAPLRARAAWLALCLALCLAPGPLLAAAGPRGPAGEAPAGGPAAPAIRAARLFVTDPWGTDRLLAETAAPACQPAAAGSGDLVLRPGQTAQTIEGMGASLTESAALAIMSLAQPERDRLMRQLFDRETGLGISLLRQPMGASDFAASIYSYDDLPDGRTDPELAHFSLEREEAAILPLLRQARAINPELRIIGSPWSPPAWMKSGASMRGAAGGVLEPRWYQAYAAYFVRFIQAYAANGLPVVAVTPQNEMNYGPAAYPGMVWTPAEEAAFISSALGPALRRAGLDTRILVWDHNWDRADLAAAILADPGAAAHASGVAWHWYGGSPVAMASLLERFPGSEAWFTEGGSGRWIGGGSFHGQFRDGICQAVAIFANGSKSLVWWNLALDQRNGPVVYPNTDNHGLVEIDTATGSLASPCRAGYYALGHFSRFVRPGAARIAVDDAGSGLRAVAFRNPDGGLVLVAANPCLSAQAGRAVLDGRAWDFEVPGEGAVSLVLRP